MSKTSRWMVGLLAVWMLAVGVAGVRAEEDSIDTISDVPRRARLALFKAQEKRDTGQAEEACKILQDLLGKHPEEDHFLVRFHLGLSLSLADRPEEALIQYRASVEKQDRFAQGWLSLGETAYNLGRYGEAGDALLRGYERSETRPPNLAYYAAASYLLAGNAERAVPLLEDLVSGRHGGSRMEWYRALISACLETGNAAGGETAVAGVLRDFGDEPEAWTLAYQYSVAQADYFQAAVALTITGYLRPLSRSEEIQLGNLYSAIGVPAAAGVHFESALGEDAGPDDFERLASAYLAAHDPDTALRTLTLALEKSPTGRLWSLLGDLHYMQENYEESFKAFEKCVTMDPDCGRGYLMMGYCAIETGDVGEAMVRLKTASGFPEQERTARDLMKRVQRMKS